jgi:hypothetical protein
MISRRPSGVTHRPGGGRCQGFPPDGRRENAKPPVGNADADNGQWRGERATVRELDQTDLPAGQLDRVDIALNQGA